MTGNLQLQGLVPPDGYFSPLGRLLLSRRSHLVARYMCWRVTIGCGLTLNLSDEKIANSGDIEGIEPKFLDVSFGISVFLIQEFQEVIHMFSLSDHS